jgi:hypothetical protein
MINTPAIHLLARLTAPVLGRLFGVSAYGTIAVLTGFLCGYPMGSKVTADLIRQGYLSVEEGQYLLSFCNNTSPMFIVSYLMWQNLKCPERTLPSLVILIAAPVTVSFLVRLRNRNLSSDRLSSNWKNSRKNSRKTSYYQPAQTGALNDVLDDSIMNGFEAITKVGGYMMIFSIIISLLQTFIHDGNIWGTYFLASLELTNGIDVLCTAFSSSHLYIASLTLTAFGGWCAVAQTHSMIHGTGLKLSPHIIEKLATAVVTSLYAYCYISLF